MYEEEDFNSYKKYDSYLNDMFEEVSNLIQDLHDTKCPICGENLQITKDSSFIYIECLGAACILPAEYGKLNIDIFMNLPFNELKEQYKKYGEYNEY
jgi:hypothetical protein